MGQPVKSDDLFAAWSRGQWSRHYLFAGQEDFLIEQALRQAEEHLLKDDDAKLNRDRFDGEEHSVGEILQTCQTLPFLSSHRLVRIDHASAFGAAEQRELAEAIPKLPPETTLLFIWGKEWRRDDARKPLVESIIDHGQVVIFWPMFPEAAARWVVQRAKQIYKKSIPPETAAWLVQQLGEPLRPLDQELAKVSAYVGGRPEITLEDLQASFGYEKASSPFEWLAAIRGKNAAEAARVLQALLEEGEEPHRLLALVSRALRDWLSAKGSGENAAMLAMRFHLKRGEENQFVREMGRWTEAALMKAIEDSLQAEQSIKSGKENPEMSLSLLTLRLCGLESAHLLR
jgi:DNA polymerase-3 subunit delta